MILADVMTFLGRLHPMVVHLPLGFLVLAFLFRMGCVPGNRVEFVIAHDGLRRAGVEHPAHDADGLKLPRPAVDEIADEDRASIRVAPGA